MEEHDAIAIETTGNCQPVVEVAGSWLDQFRVVGAPHRSWWRRTRNRSKEAAKAFIGLLKATDLRRRSLLFPRPFSPEDAKIEGPLIVEQHHLAYGKPWCLGRDQFDYLMSRGLKPNHKVLDFGCGSMRVGIWLTSYLNEGSYFGIEPHRKSLEAAATYEIPLHGLVEKRPRLLWDDQYSCEYFGDSFDFVLAFSVFHWLGSEQTSVALTRILKRLNPGGRIVVYGVIPLSEEQLRDQFRLKVDHRGTHESTFFREIRQFTELVAISC
jgi:SAM-dependent methyltransferase